MRFFLLIFLIYFLVIPISIAGYQDDIGYTALKKKLWSKVPDGSIIQLVTQVEADVMIDHDGDDQTDKISVWMPNPGHAEFNGKLIYNRSGSPAFFSSHATGVGRYFYGSTSSIAPGLISVESFRSGHWLGKGFLRTGEIYRPLSSASRVANQSWVGEIKNLNSEILRRLDWAIQTDEFVHTAGPCLSNKPLLGSAFNTIAVGRAIGESGAGSVAVDNLYTAGRTCPQLIAPRKNPSSETPLVASAAAILADLGHRNPDLSTDPVFQKAINRNGDTIYNAERSKVIKAALMAGADRVTNNTVIIDGNIPNITDYRLKPENRTANGLDRRYGAGQLNIYHCYFIIAGGESNSKEDAHGSRGVIGNYGFDYDPYFGGVDGSNSIASYYFTVDGKFKHLWASLVWNIKIKGCTGTTFKGDGILYYLDLYLYDITEPNDPDLISSSRSSLVNTENLWIQLSKQRRYLLQVEVGAGQSPFLWDYALAWRIGNSPEEQESFHE